jgi:tetratricopeptide (TPR) repeat protein
MIRMVKTQGYRCVDRRHHRRRWFNVLCCFALLLAATGCSRQARKQEHIARADNYFQKGDFESARIEYLNALRLDTASVPAIKGLGAIYFERGSFRAAIPFLLRAEELTPDDLQTRLRLGQVYFAARQFDKARSEAEFVLSKDPSQGDALLLLCDLPNTPEQVASAQRRIDALRQKMGDTATLQMALAGLYAREKRWPETLDSLQQAIRLEPKSAMAHLALGNFFWLKNALPDAARELKAATELDPAGSAAHLRYAQFLFSTGAVAEAKGCLEKMTGKNPGYAPAWNLLAEIALQQKSYEDCLRLTQKVLAVDPQDYEALLIRSRLELAQNQVNQTIKDLEELERLYPGAPQVKYWLARAFLLDRNFPKATSNLEQAIASRPEFTEASLLLAQINIQQGAATATVQPLRNLVERQPKLADAHFLLVEAYRALGRPDEAMAVLQNMAELFPKEPRVPFETGLLLRAKNKPTDARSAFLKALELAPAFHAAAEQLVDMDLKEQNLAAAEERAQRQIQNAPRAPEPQFLLARVYLGRNGQAAAEAALLKAIELDPGYRPAFLALAGLYARSNKQNEALDKLDALLARNPHDLVALTGIAAIHESRGDFPQAAKAYERILEADPQSTLALNNLAYLYSEQLGQPDKGYELATKARHLLPQDPSVADTLGWICYKRGEYGQALALLEESAAKLLVEPEVLFHLGMVHYMMGEEQPARAAFQRALQSGRDFPERDAAVERLALLEVNPATGEQALAALEKRLAAQPDDPVALMRLGALSEQNGRLEKARDAYQALLRANPDFKDALIRLAFIDVRLGDPKKGLEIARAVRKKVSADPQTAHLLGKLAWQAGDHAWAVSLLQESDLGQPGQAEVLYDLALAYYSVGRAHDAKEAMESALRVNPSFSSAEAARKFLFLLDLLERPGDYQLAESQANAVLKDEPENLPALFLGAIAEEELGRLDEARHAYESLLARYQLFALAQKRLSILYFEHFSEEQKALELAIKARETLRDEPNLAAVLGKIAFRRDDYGRSARLLQEAARDSHADAEVFYYLGLANYRQNQFKECRQALQTALALSAKNPLAEEARQILGKLP